MIERQRALGAGVGLGQALQALDAHAYDHRAGEGRARFIGKQDALAGLAVGTADPGRGLAQFGRSFAGRPMATHLPESDASAYQIVVGWVGWGLTMRRVCTL